MKQYLENLSPNQIIKLKKYGIFFGGVLTLITFAFFFVHFLVGKKPPTNSEAQNLEVASVEGNDFDSRNQKSAINKTQDDLEELKKEIENERKAREALEAQRADDMSTHKKELDKLKQQEEYKNKLLQKKLEDSKKQKSNDFVDDSDGKNSSESKGNTGGNGYPQPQKNITEPVRQDITFDTASVDYQAIDDSKPFVKNSKNYVPAGTYCRAVTLSSADAKAGVTASSNAAPVTFKIMDGCVLPNDKKTIALKGAHILASVYGDIATERGIVRLENISFFDKKDDTAYDIPVQGTVADISGRNGIKGVATLRNDKILMSAGVSGLLSGVGSVAQQASTTQAIGGGGIINTVSPGQLGTNVAGGAVSKAGDNLSNYYIKLAESYAPVIEVRPGSIVNVIFQQGFPVKDAKAIDAYAQQMTQAKMAQEQSGGGQMQPLMQAPTQSVPEGTSPSSSLPSKSDMQASVASQVRSQTDTNEFAG